MVSTKVNSMKLKTELKESEDNEKTIGFSYKDGTGNLQGGEERVAEVSLQCWGF